jgi:arginase
VSLDESLRELRLPSWCDPEVPVPTIGVIGVPTSAGAHAPGQERAPAAFRQAGIVELLTEQGLEVHDRGDLPKVRWSPDQASPRAQHSEQVAHLATAVADATASALEDHEILLVLGGDCTIEVGVVSGFVQRPQRIGLLYLDAGPDLNVPSSVRLGFLDWMGTAHLLGLPEATQPLSHIGPRFPLLDPDQIVYVGAVPDELTDWEQRVVIEKGLQVHWVDQVTGRARQAAQEALADIEDSVDRLLVHFDVDVVDFIDFPAADFPTINAGLTLIEAFECVEVFAHHPKFAALSICEFNPDHVDEEHKLVRTFVERLAKALAPHSLL